MQKNTRTILFLFPYPLGHAPSQRFRFEQYLDWLVEQGYSIETQSFLTPKGWQVLYLRGQTMTKISSLVRGVGRRLALFFGPLQRADTVFIHREVAPIGPPLFEWLIAKVFRKRVVYDFDDSIWLPNTSDENRVISGVKWHGKVKSICRWSSVISVGNRYLAQFAQSYATHVIINPTTVDTNKHVPAHRVNTPEVITIGWTGTHSTLKYLRALDEVFVQLEAAFPSAIRFLIIADRRPDLPVKNLNFIPWSEDSEVSDLQQIDIGVMPLSDDAWTKGKCGLKAIQYMSLGIPTVASPVGVNVEIIHDGDTGYLCDTVGAWLERLSVLIRDTALRKKIGEAGRQRVWQAYSTEANRSVVLSLFR